MNLDNLQMNKSYLSELINIASVSQEQSVLMLLLIQVISSIVLSFILVDGARRSIKKSEINQVFIKSLYILPVLVMGIMYFVGSSISLSIGLLGSLSIIRFRTAIKNPYELILILWAILIGIGTGSGEIFATFIISIVIYIYIYLTKGIKEAKELDFILSVVSSKDSAKDIVSVFNENFISYSFISSSYQSEEYSYVFSLNKSSSENIDRLMPLFSNFDFIKSFHLSKSYEDI